MSEESTSRAERTRTEIVAAAHRLFMERGFHGTSMRQIAQEAGVALGGIYNHFATKGDIFAAVLMERHPYHEVLPLMIAAEGDTLEEILRDAARRMVGALEKRTDFLNLTFIEVVEFKGQHMPQLFQVIFPQVMVLSQRFLASRDELRPIPVFVLVRAFIGLFFSFLITDIFIAEHLPPEGRENALDYFIDIYLHGIMRQDDSAKELP
jgi:AcrR family transcriptional regulator